MAVHPNIQIAIISGLVTILVGLMTAYAAYKGSIRGTKDQIEHERDNLQNAIDKQNIFVRNSIERFLSNEIKKNFMIINNTNLSAKITDSHVPFSYGFGDTPTKISFTEYDKLKYDLIKFESEVVERIINIYDMFHLIERKNNIVSFTQIEYEDFRKVFNICLRRYNKI